MQFRKESNTYIISLNRGEPIKQTLNAFFNKENIQGGQIRGIGAVGPATLSFYDVHMRAYRTTEYPEEYELVSLLGNVSETGLHAHVSIAGPDGVCHGGHLEEAMVSLAGEFFLEIMGPIRRKADAETGLRFFDL